MYTTPIPIKKFWVRAVVHLMLLAAALIFAFPFYWVATSAVKPLNEVMALPVNWWPSEFQWDTFWNAATFSEDTSPYYRNWDGFFAAVTFNGAGEGTASAQAWDAWRFFFGAFFIRCVGNTLFVTIAGVIGTVVSNALVAYGFFANCMARAGDALLHHAVHHDDPVSGRHDSAVHSIRQGWLGGNALSVVGPVLFRQRVQYLSPAAVFPHDSLRSLRCRPHRRLHRIRHLLARDRASFASGALGWWRYFISCTPGTIFWLH